MPAYSIQQYSQNWQARLDNVIDLSKRKRILQAQMSNKGRITGPSGGNYVEWPIFVGSRKPHEFDRNTPPVFATPDNLRMPQLGWANTQYGEQLHVIDLEENMGKEKFIDMVENCYRSVEKSFTDEWPSTWFQDGSVQANPNNAIYGLKSAMKYYSAATATAAAPRQGYEGKVRLPNGTYATYDTTLGALGGSWAGGASATTTYTSGAATFHFWPAGRGDAKFDAWSPLVVNTTSQGWGSSSAAFDTTYCEDQIDFGMEYSNRNNGAEGKGMVDLILWTSAHNLIWRKRYSSTNRVLVERIPMVMDAGGSTQGTNNALQTGEPVIVHNGAFLATDFDLEDDLIIGVNTGAVEYRTVYQRISSGPRIGDQRMVVSYEAEIPGGSGLMVGGRTHGQFIIHSPRKMVFWYPLGNYTT